MIIRNCRKEGRKEGRRRRRRRRRSRKGTYIEPPEGPASSFEKEVGCGEVGGGFILRGLLDGIHGMVMRRGAH